MNFIYNILAGNRYKNVIVITENGNHRELVESAFKGCIVASHKLMADEQYNELMGILNKDPEDLIALIDLDILKKLHLQSHQDDPHKATADYLKVDRQTGKLAFFMTMNYLDSEEFQTHFMAKYQGNQVHSLNLKDHQISQLRVSVLVLFDEDFRTSNDRSDIDHANVRITRQDIEQARFVQYQGKHGLITMKMRGESIPDECPRVTRRDLGINHW